MANILNVSSPIASHNELQTNKGLTNQSVDPSMKNQVDPNNVVRADQRENANNEQNKNDGRLPPNSNLANFLRGVRDNIDITSLVTRLYFDMGIQVESGINDDFAVELSKFLDMTKLDADEVKTFLQEQIEANTAFSGKFFDTVRDCLYHSKQIEQRGQIIEFAKSIDNMQSGRHLLANIKDNLTSISKLMFRSDREALNELVSKLDFNSSNGDTDKNVDIIKNDIIPLLKGYIKKTGDLGSIRSNISLLIYNTARYENGNGTRIEYAFKKLLGYDDIKNEFIKNFNLSDEDLSGYTKDELLNLINSNLNKVGSDRINEWTNRFVDITERALSGNAGQETKQVFENIVTSILINNSVYMPLVHIMLPMELMGKKMYSEIWADPDARGDGASDENRLTRMFIKFDIESLGVFDLVLDYSAKKVDVNLFYPEKLRSLEGEFKRGILQILNKNDVSYGVVHLDRNENNLAISDVFPKLVERRQVVDVRI